MQSITRNLEMAENRLSAEKMFSPSASPAPPYLYFLIYNDKKDPLSNLKSLAAPVLKRKKKTQHNTTPQHTQADCESPSQYRNTIVFHVLINSNPPQVCLSADISPKPRQIAVSRGVNKAEARCDISRRTEASLGRRAAEWEKKKKGEVEEEEEGEKSEAGEEGAGRAA